MNTPLLLRFPLFKNASTQSSQAHHLIRTLASYTGYDLTNYRSLVRFRGLDASKFLQNLITNDINKLTSTTQSIYSMVLNSRGRLVDDVILHSSHGDDYLIEIDASVEQEFILTCLKMKMRKKVEISSASGEFRLFALAASSSGGDETAAAVVAKNTENTIFHNRDPRYDALGYRAILKTNLKRIL